MIITSQQALFFKEHGYIEFDATLFKPEAIVTAANACFEKRKREQEDVNPIILGRDLWREEPILEKLAMKTLAPLTLNLANKPVLRLALDQWITKESLWKEPSSFKELFAIQGLSLLVLFTNIPNHTLASPKVGIIPLPSDSSHCLIVRPNILLDWTKLASLPDDATIYIVAYAGLEAVYVQNLKDPALYELKKLRYQPGDALRSDSHPLIR
jgi:hypothetical protein